MVDRGTLSAQASYTCSAGAAHWRVSASLARKISKARLCGGVRQGCVVEIGTNRSGLAVVVFAKLSNSIQPDSAVTLRYQYADHD